jgi:hypothetical protein
MSAPTWLLLTLQLAGAGATPTAPTTLTAAGAATASAITAPAHTVAAATTDRTIAPTAPPAVVATATIAVHAPIHGCGHVYHAQRAAGGAGVGGAGVPAALAKGVCSGAQQALLSAYQPPVPRPAGSCTAPGLLPSRGVCVVRQPWMSVGGCRRPGRTVGRVTAPMQVRGPPKVHTAPPLLPASSPPVSRESLAPSFTAVVVLVSVMLAPSTVAPFEVTKPTSAASPALPSPPSPPLSPPPPPPAWVRRRP